MDNILYNLGMGILLTVVLIGSVLWGASAIYEGINKEVCTRSCQSLECYNTCANLGIKDFEKQVKYVGVK